MSSRSCKSSALRASGPATERLPSFNAPGGGARWPRFGTMSKLGLWPKTPQRWAGVRIEPPMSEPNSAAVKPAASEAAEPPDEPPGPHSSAHGLLVVP